MSIDEKLILLIAYTSLLMEVEKLKGNEKWSMFIFLCSLIATIYYLFRLV